MQCIFHFWQSFVPLIFEEKKYIQSFSKQPIDYDKSLGFFYDDPSLANLILIVQVKARRVFAFEIFPLIHRKTNHKPRQQRCKLSSINNRKLAPLAAFEAPLSNCSLGTCNKCIETRVLSGCPKLFHCKHTCCLTEATGTHHVCVQSLHFQNTHTHTPLAANKIINSV